jgi:hypothetical protein
LISREWISTSEVDAAIAKSKSGKAAWSRSLMVNVYKGKGDALECGSYLGIKLLD